MKYQANRNYSSNDMIMTPEHIAKMLVDHFKPTGMVLEPCKGSGNFLKYLPASSQWCEITEGKDFMQFEDHVDWIITNPPWSQIRRFLQHSMKLSDNVCFLFTINHLWTRARLRDIKQHGFGIREIALFDAPRELNASGFACGMVHLQRGYKGDIRFTELGGCSV